jgi:hypothetical protein
VSLTGGTAETVMDTVLVPAGTMEVGDVLNVKILGTKIGTAGIVTLRLYTNVTPDLTGSPVLVATLASGATDLWAKLSREITFVSLSSQLVFPPGTSAADDITLSTATPGALTVNFAIQQYFVVSFQNGNGSDTSYLKTDYFEIIR